MSLAFRSAWVAVLGLGLVTACGSESSFRPWTPDDDSDEGSDAQDRPGGNGGGGWGDWEIDSIPDIALVLGVMHDDTAMSEVVVADLRGRILDSWTPPVNDITQLPSHISKVQAVAPGEVLVTTTSDGFWYEKSRGGPDFGNTTQQDDVLPLRTWIGPTEIWHGDLVEGTWTRQLHMEWDTGRYVIDGTGQELPTVAWAAVWGLQVTPWRGSDHHLMLSWFDRPCSDEGAQRVLVVSTNGEGRDQERFWTLDRDWDMGFEPVWLDAQSGLQNDGEEVILAHVSDDSCMQPRLTQDQIVRWRVDGRPEVLYTAPPNVTPRARLHGPTGAALTLIPPNQDHDWIMRWLGDDEAIGAAFEHPFSARVVAPLDPEHGAALLALFDGHKATDELVLVADGKDVWRIRELKQGLGTRDIRLIDGAVVAIP